MIESYDFIEIYNADKLSKIPKHLNTSLNVIIEEHHKENKIKENPYNLMVSWRNITKGKVKSPTVQTIKKLTDIFIYTYIKHDKQPLKGRIRILNPDNFLEQAKERFIIAKDFHDEYPHHPMHNCLNVFTGKLQPKLDFLVDLTDYVKKCDRELLNLPKNKGVRWDLEEWRRTANIPIKNSWEEQYD